MKTGIIDLGSNSCRLLIADMPAGKTLLALRIPTRMGQGIGERRLHSEAMQCSLAAIQKFWALMQEFKVEKSLISATAAVREASNRQEFLDLVYQQIGQPIRVLSGAEEAFWGYQGVKWNFPYLENPVIMDLGGGSTEFSWMEQDNLACISTKVGSVRMTENSYSEAEILSFLEPALKRIKGSQRSLLAIGGTATTLAALATSQKKYSDREGCCLKMEQIQKIQARLAALTLEERRNLPELSPDRADIILAGIQVIILVMRQLNQQELLVSNTGLMHGLALGLATDLTIKNVLTYE